MRLIRLDQLDMNPADTVFRQSPVPSILFSIVGFTLVAAGIFMLSQRRLGCIEWALGFAWIGGGLLFLKIGVDGWRGARRETNWVLRMSPSGQIALKFRSYLNWRFPADALQVIVIDPAELLCVRKNERRFVTQSSDGTRRERRIALEILLRNPMPEELPAALAVERIFRGVGKGFAKGRYKHECVQVMENTVLRVPWVDTGTKIIPKIAVALESLRTVAPVGPPVTGDDDFSPAALAKLSPAEQDARLRQLANNDSMLATETVKLLYNCSTKEAVDQVDCWRSEPLAKG